MSFTNSTDAISTIVAISAYSAGHSFGKYGRISINNKEFVHFPRGLGVMTLDDTSGEEIARHSFDTFQSETASEAFVQYVAELSPGSIVVVVANDDASASLTDNAKDAMNSLGGILIKNLQYRGSYSLIGMKGAKPGSRPEVVNNKAAVGLEETIIFSPPISADPSKGKRMLTVRSSGGASGNTADVLIDSSSILLRGNRGLNVVVFSGHMGSAQYERNFDTCESYDEANEFAEFIRGLPDARLVAVACMGDCSRRLNNRARNALRSLGGILFEKLEFQSSYALIGVKGAPSGSSVEAVDHSAPVIINKYSLTPFRSPREVLKVTSAGYYAGNTAQVSIGNINMLLHKGRGLNVMVISGKDNLVVREQRFDTFASDTAANNFARFIQSVPSGHIVAVTCMGECSRYLNSAAQNALSSIGGEQFKRLSFRFSYALLGEKGAIPGSRPEVFDIGAVHLREPRFAIHFSERTLIVRSAGRNAGNVADIVIGSQSVLHNVNRGLNVVVIDRASWSVLLQGTFDTSVSEAAANSFANFIESQQNDRIIAVACMHDCSNRLNSRALSALESLGAKACNELTFGSSYALIGKKGATAGSRPEILDTTAVVSLVEQLGP